MKKKGFTLIELLAVIVILAIIALIATPLVLKYIEKSRKESKVDSAYSFVRNLETEIANYSIKNNGKKYNKAPIGGDYYEFNDFDTDKEIDTTVKGDKPDSIKVCLSSLGQVEKAMFEYGKYYVSYDGKKGSISDKDIYDNFSCSKTNEDVMFEIDITFNEVETDYYDGTGTINKTIYDMFIGSSEYELIIDDEKVMNVYAVEGDIYKLMMTDALPYRSDEYLLVYFIKEDYELIIETNMELTGIHNIKISYPTKVNDNTLFAIMNHEDDPNLGYRIMLHDSDFIEGDATVLIEDENGVVYLNQNVVFADSDGDGIYGLDDCRDYKVSFPELYDAIKEGKKIKITVTQNIDGNDVTRVLINDYITKTDEYFDYYIGRTAFFLAYAC